MIKPYFKNGILTEKFEAITPGFIEALSIGFVRYMGDSRTSKSGMERPLSVLFSVDTHENSEIIYQYFASAFKIIGIDYEPAGNIDVKEL